MDINDLLSNFVSIIYEALPFIVLGVVIAGLLEEFVPQQAMIRIMPSNKYLAIAIGGVLGIIFPMCECGIIVVMKRLLRKGLPLSVCVCYMLAGPVINVVVVLSTFVAFNYSDKSSFVLGGPYYVVFLRVGLSFVVAFITALVVDVLYKKYGNDLLHPSVKRGLGHPDEEAAITHVVNVGGAQIPVSLGQRSWWQSLDHITETALHDFVDIMAFLILGAGCAVLGRAWMETSGFNERVGDMPALSILMLMGAAVLFCLCSEADAFVAANFPATLPGASKLAFLVLGPMFDLKLLMMYTRVFRPKLIYTIIITVAVQVFAYCLIVHYCSFWIAAHHDAELLQGTWYTVSTDAGGKSTGEDRTDTITYDGNKYVKSRGGKTWQAGTFSIVDATDRKKEIDYICTEGDQKGKHFRAIYTLVEEDHQICTDDGNDHRPKDFNGKEGFQRRTKRLKE